MPPERLAPRRRQTRRLGLIAEAVVACVALDTEEREAFACCIVLQCFCFGIALGVFFLLLKKQLPAWQFAKQMVRGNRAQAKAPEAKGVASTARPPSKAGPAKAAPKQPQNAPVRRAMPAPVAHAPAVPDCAGQTRPGDSAGGSVAGSKDANGSNAVADGCKRSVTFQPEYGPRHVVHRSSLPSYELGDCFPRTAVVVLTYLASPRLPVALATWVPDAAYMGFDVVLMVSAPPAETAAFERTHSLPRQRLYLNNTFGLLNESDTPYLERWKVQAFFAELVRPARHQWYVMLDDDTLPNLPSLSHVLCTLYLRASSGRYARRGLYMGWMPHDPEEGMQTFASGQGFLMDDLAVAALQRRVASVARVRSRDACFSQTTLRRYPRWWASGCCAVSDGVVRSFDNFIGSCLSFTNVSKVSLGDGDGRVGWWGRLFHHGGELKQPKKLEHHAVRVKQIGWQAAADEAQRAGFHLQGYPDALHAALSRIDPRVNPRIDPHQGGGRVVNLSAPLRVVRTGEDGREVEDFVKRPEVSPIEALTKLCVHLPSESVGISRRDQPLVTGATSKWLEMFGPG